MSEIEVKVGTCNWIVESSEEASLAKAMWAVAEKGGIDINDFTRAFIFTLRMLNFNSRWARSGLNRKP